MTKTDTEKLQIAIDHIVKCHDAFDALTTDFNKTFKREADGDFLVSAHDWYNLHCLINGHFPARPTIPAEYLEASHD